MTADAPTHDPRVSPRVSLRESLAVVAITDDLRDGVDGLVARACAAERGGITMLQVRLKSAHTRDLVMITRQLVAALHIPVVVNDRVDVALVARAAGAHLGMDDLPIVDARQLVPPGFVLGASLGRLDDLKRLGDADYVGIGPVFGTPSKLDAGAALGIAGTATLARAAGRPAVAIGGVDITNAESIVSAGCVGVSVIRAVLSSADPEQAARRLREAVTRGLAAVVA